MAIATSIELDRIQTVIDIDHFSGTTSMAGNASDFLEEDAVAVEQAFDPRPASQLTDFLEYFNFNEYKGGRFKDSGSWKLCSSRNGLIFLSAMIACYIVVYIGLALNALAEKGTGMVVGYHRGGGEDPGAEDLKMWHLLPDGDLQFEEIR